LYLHYQGCRTSLRIGARHNFENTRHRVGYQAKKRESYVNLMVKKPLLGLLGTVSLIQ
jgi:hypothetical protein